jgi:hypothetical protein
LFDNFQQALHDNDTLPLAPRELQLRKPKILDCGYGTGGWIEDLLNSDLFEFDEENDVSNKVSVTRRPVPESESCDGEPDPKALEIR